MTAPAKKKILVSTTIQSPIEKVWMCWTTPEHIMKWNAAADEWHCPTATNDLRAGGRFVYHMAARDESMGFNFCGTYDVVTRPNRLKYTLDDDRKVTVNFSEEDGITTVTEEFEAEATNSLELQQTGWQAILDRFKHLVESQD
ncbi:MAG: SRPBCC domain-containing protein [Saprospiraceae bacterium]|nr:SRPBCC domain-containing protein [Saprospiraceae bacterium]